MRKINEVIIHCSATREGKEYHAADIDRWHKIRGFRCIGYHYVIALDGTIEVGRPIDEVGAHVKGHNANSVGICYIGGLDKNGRPKDTRTPAQQAALDRLVWRMSVMCLNMGWGLPKLRGHHDYNKNKACPCFDVKQWYAES